MHSCLPMLLALGGALPARAEPVAEVDAPTEQEAEQAGPETLPATPHAHARPAQVAPTWPAPAPPLDPGLDLLTAALRAPVVDGLRWVGLAPEDLRGGRETTNAGLSTPPDRWRLPSADAALDDPLWLPALVGDRRAVLQADLDAALPTWTGVRRLAQAELGQPRGDGTCERGANRGLLAEAEASAAVLRRQRTWLQEQVTPELDHIAGGLLAEARWTRCRVEAALAGVPPLERHWLAEELERQVLVDSDSDEAERFERALRRARAWEAVDRPALLAAGLDWADAVRRAALELQALPPEAWPRGPLRVPTGLGEVWLGSTWDDVLEGDPVLLLDPGGGDHWRFLTDEHPQGVPPRPVAGWIDLSGDDQWWGQAAGPGGALFGVSAGIDAQGDDTWRTGLLGQGAAWFGVATWLDAQGDDAGLGTAAVQGFAGHGLGVLRDAGSGQDTWRAGAWAQGAALTGGVALAHDGGGDDRYVLGGLHEDSGNRLPGHFSAYGQGFAMGARPWLGGGLGWLQDEDGHDQYAGGLWVQGGSYWHSLGVLVDGGGNDTYLSDQYSQGSGIHLSAAGLFELGGDDRYLTRYLGQGSGHDKAVTWLLDLAGDDVYTGQDTVQGASLTNAASFFVDAAGDDLYAARTAQTRGYTNRAREHGSAALFLDLQGADRYLGGDAAAPAAPTGPGGHGLALDLDAAVDPAAGQNPTGTPDGVSSVQGPPPATPDAARALLLANTRWLAPYPDTAAAVDLVVQAGPEAVGWVLPLADGEMHLRSYTVQAVVERWAAQGSPEELARVAAAIRASAEGWPAREDDATLRWHAAWMGILLAQDAALYEPAIAVADLARLHPSWTVRREGWHLSRALAAQDAVPRIMASTWRQAALDALAEEPLGEVRAAAARFLSAGGGAAALAPLARSLRRGGLEGREAAEQALAALIAAGHGEAALEVLRPLAEAGEGPTRDAALRLVGATGLKGALPVLERALAEADPRVRRAALQGLQAHGSRAADRLLAAHRARETEPRVLAGLSP